MPACPTKIIRRRPVSPAGSSLTADAPCSRRLQPFQWLSALVVLVCLVSLVSAGLRTRRSREEDGEYLSELAYAQQPGSYEPYFLRRQERPAEGYVTNAGLGEDSGAGGGTEEEAGRDPRLEATPARTAATTLEGSPPVTLVTTVPTLVTTRLTLATILLMRILSLVAKTPDLTTRTRIVMMMMTEKKPMTVEKMKGRRRRRR